uniref:Uncharacterized protein n=1 Tax=Fibrocapsa japonica TaxID=94617 RepID=A0A7S2XXQ4_9STRA
MKNKLQQLEQVLPPAVAAAVLTEVPTILRLNVEKNVCPRVEHIKAKFPQRPVEELVLEAPGLVGFTTSSLQKRLDQLSTLLPSRAAEDIVCEYPAIIVRNIEHGLTNKVNHLNQLLGLSDEDGKCFWANNPRVVSFGYNQYGRILYQQQQSEMCLSENDLYEIVDTSIDEYEGKNPGYHQFLVDQLGIHSLLLDEEDGSNICNAPSAAQLESVLARAWKIQVEGVNQK